jgi:hypothetical protein
MKYVIILLFLYSCAIRKSNRANEFIENIADKTFQNDWSKDSSGCLGLRFKYVEYINSKFSNWIGADTTHVEILLGKPNVALHHDNIYSFYYYLKGHCGKPNYDKWTLVVDFKKNKAFDFGIPIP